MGAAASGAAMVVTVVGNGEGVEPSDDSSESKSVIMLSSTEGGLSNEDTGERKSN